MSKKKNNVEKTTEQQEVVQEASIVTDVTNEKEYIITGDMSITHCGKQYMQGEKIILPKDCAEKLSKYLSEAKK